MSQETTGSDQNMPAERKQKPQPNRKLKVEPGKGQLSPEAFARGQKFNALLLENEYSHADFARDTGITLAAVWKYVNGQLDIAKMRNKTLERFLDGLKVSDTWAWSYFDIPADARKGWRTFRRPPFGHGEDERNLVDIVLANPLQGELTVPSGYVITIDPSTDNVGLIVTQMSDRYFVTPADLLQGQGKILGQLVRVDTGYRRDIPQPDKARQLSGS